MSTKEVEVLKGKVQDSLTFQESLQTELVVNQEKLMAELSGKSSQLSPEVV